MGLGGSNRRGSRRPEALRSGNGSHPSARKLVFTISSRLEEGREIQRRILDAIEGHGFDGQSFFACKLALEEAIVNAIKHGNCLDPKKKVHVEARLSPQKVQISVEDEGPGFDRHCVPDPTAQENIEKCSGRGILLIESYMNRVTWDRGGRRLTMVKSRDEER